jgi:hypothetical protein
VNQEPYKISRFCTVLLFNDTAEKLSNSWIEG